MRTFISIAGGALIGLAISAYPDHLWLRWPLIIVACGAWGAAVGGWPKSR